jgi:2-dehydro-3-deoxygluconokinase
VAEEAMRTARRHGAVVSYDLNYRPSLWADYGGLDRAQEVNRSLVRHADVLFGNEEDFTAALGFDVPATAADFTDLQAGNFQQMIASVTREFGQLRVVATTLRTATTASVNDWGAIAWADGRFYQATYRPGLAILDRVGGGDSFASGLIFGLMETGDPAMAVEYGAAHGALSMTTPGDTSMATRAEVAALVRGASARVQR